MTNYNDEEKDLPGSGEEAEKLSGSGDGGEQLTVSGDGGEQLTVSGDGGEQLSGSGGGGEQLTGSSGEAGKIACAGDGAKKLSGAADESKTVSDCAGLAKQLSEPADETKLSSDCGEQARILPDWQKVFVSREEFLKFAGLLMGSAIVFIGAVPGLAFVFNYIMMPPAKVWIKVGPVEKFKEGETVEVRFEDPSVLPWDGVSGHRSAWLRRETADNFIAFAINCTHLGCPVRWEAKAELFLCPCHGGVYDKIGDVAAGPPPRPLPRFPVRLNDGQVEIEVRPVLTEG